MTTAQTNKLSTAIGKLTGEREWRCTRCGKLLGHLLDGRLHLQIARGRAYLVGFPATTACTGCRAMNELATANALVEQPKPKAAITAR
jgi:phage FluMu protein Com